jgi:hypothetical protein
MGPDGIFFFKIAIFFSETIDPFECKCGLNGPLPILFLVLIRKTRWLPSQHIVLT